MWLADDSAGIGLLQEFRAWWDTLCKEGVRYGYDADSVKTYLLVKPDLLEEAHRLFQGTGVQIVTDGTRYLVSECHRSTGISQGFPTRQGFGMGNEIEQLATFATTEPHAAFTALTPGLRGKCTFILRTLPVDEEDLQPLDDKIANVLLPVLLGRGKFAESMMALLRLPARLGGIGLPFLSAVAKTEFTASQAMTKGQVEEMVRQNMNHKLPSVENLHADVVRARNASKKQRRKAEQAR